MLKDLVKGRVCFRYYQNGNLFYVTDPTSDFPIGLEFPVPISSKTTGSARFLATDKGILFMKHIKNHLEDVEKAREAKNENGS